MYFLLSFMLIVPADFSCLAKGSNRCIFLTKISDSKDYSLFSESEINRKVQLVWCTSSCNVMYATLFKIGMVAPFLFSLLGNDARFVCQILENIAQFQSPR